MIRGSHGWAHIDDARKKELIEAIASGRPTAGPVHAELDLTDRCNVACYFCNQQDLRTKEQLSVERIQSLLAEMVPNGLRSVRLSGGGDPLFHREILPVLDLLESHGVIVDNVTTNGVALTEEVSRRLVERKAREVVISLNAADREDYHRMMQVKPDLFEKVIANVRYLLRLRGDSPYPNVAIQFLLDRRNLLRMVDMYEVAEALGPDRIAFNAVLQIYNDVVETDLLLRPADAELARPLVLEMLRRDKGKDRLQIDFPVSGWNHMLDEVRAEVDAQPTNLYPTAPSFRNENAGCFFGWYTTAITGNGDVRPCCLLLNPGTKPLGNVNRSSFGDVWTGPAYSEMRDEMRDVLLLEGKIKFEDGKFRQIQEPCVKEHLCWLKNMFFRGDDAFYAELAKAMEAARRREIRPIGSRAQVRRYVQRLMIRSPQFKRIYNGLGRRSLRFRRWLDQRLGIRTVGAIGAR